MGALAITSFCAQIGPGCAEVVLGVGHVGLCSQCLPLSRPGWFAQQPLTLQLRHSEQPTVPLELQASQGAPSLSQGPSVLVKPSSPLSLALTHHIFMLQAFSKSCARHSSPVLSCLPSPLLPWMQAPPPPDITHGLERE